MTAVFAIPQGLEDRWNKSRGQPESYLLRLAILRDFIHKVHAEKSEAMARGETKEKIGEYSAVEAKIEELRDRSPLEGVLAALLSQTVTTPARARNVPGALIKILGPDKLDRVDRDWEAALASEACRIKWDVWALDAAIELAKVEEVHADLERKLWPQGVVLYVEASPVLKPKTSEAWGGRWVAVLKPDFDASKSFGGGKWTKVFSA